MLEMCKTLCTFDSSIERRPAINVASEMIRSGVLFKNVVRHFTNSGWPIEAANNIAELGKFNAEQMLVNKTL